MKTTYKYLKKKEKFLMDLICLFIKARNLLFMEQINPEIDDKLIELLNSKLK